MIVKGVEIPPHLNHLTRKSLRILIELFKSRSLK